MGIRRKNLKRALFHMAAGSLALLLAVSPFLHTRAADAPTYSSSLSVWAKGHYDNEDIYGIGMQLSLYQIAGAEVDADTREISYTLLDEFRDTKIDLSNVSQNGIDTTFVEKLTNYIAERQISGKVISTEEKNQGRADFTDLEPGFYLVAQTGANEDYSKKYQDIDAFCISIPLLYTNSHGEEYLEYNVTVCPKLQTLEKEYVYQAVWEQVDGKWTLVLHRGQPGDTETEAVTIGDGEDLSREEAKEILYEVWDRLGPDLKPLSEDEMLVFASSGWVIALRSSTGSSGGSSGSALEEEAAASGNDVSMNLPDDWLSDDMVADAGTGLPQTGLEVIKIYVLGGGGLLLILTGIAVLRGDSDGEENKEKRRSLTLTCIAERVKHF